VTKDPFETGNQTFHNEMLSISPETESICVV